MAETAQIDQTLDLGLTDDYGARRITVAAGQSLLKALQQTGACIGAVCGGDMVCGTCHVYLAPVAGQSPEPPQAGETELLEFSRHYRPSQSRLACQVRLDARLHACAVEVAPDE